MKKLVLASVAALSLAAALPAAAQQSGMAKHEAGQATQSNSASQSSSVPRSNETRQSNNESNNPSASGMSQDQIMQAQQALEQKGFKLGKADGILGPRTERAVRDFQQKQGLQQNGQLDDQTLAALGVSSNQRETTGQGTQSSPSQTQHQPSFNDNNSQAAPSKK
jgi:peptidoglycan hydrolase-like protein with peptidoglycan-binding domain